MSLKNCETNLQVFSENSNTRSPSAEGLRKRIVTVIFGLFYNFFLFLRLKFAGFFSNRGLKITNRNFIFFRIFFFGPVRIGSGTYALPLSVCRAELSGNFIRQPCSDAPFSGRFFGRLLNIVPSVFPIDWFLS